MAEVHPLKAKRLSKGMSRAAYAAEVGISAGTLEEIEQWRRPASERTVRLLAGALDIEVEAARALCPWPKETRG